jgi:hypothetical protein
MKKIITLLLLVALISCKPSVNTYNQRSGSHKETPVAKFKAGQTVYLKPDSIKSTVVEVHDCGCRTNRFAYEVRYFNNYGDAKELYVEEYLIY